MKILFSPASPYSAKARMAAVASGLNVTAERVNTEESPEILVGNNPLGKIPVLLTDEGEAVFDSRVITQYLNRLAPGTVFPRPAARRLDAERMEALCDGITDCLLAIVYERRFRPAEKVHDAWIDRQWTKVTRGLDHLEANPPRLTGRLHAGHFAFAALLGYLALRFPGQWEKGRPKLKGFNKRFVARFPEAADILPHA